MNKERLKEFLLFIQTKTDIKSLELIEKDFYLNFLLSKLDLEEYAFKGGTCLTKVYLNYHRLSEDLDFTFKNQEVFKNKSTKQIKKICSQKINEFGRQLEKLDLNFVLNKSNKKYVEIGSNNKLVTFKLWYDSLFTNISSFLKVQINFVDIIFFPIEKKDIISLLNKRISREEIIYFKDFLEFYEKKKIFIYDIREIFVEKIRSLLTRKATKTRDLIDLFFIYQKYKIKPETLIEEFKEKLIFVINNYQKYRENFISIKEEIKNFEISDTEIEEISIIKINKENFEEFVLYLKKLLNKIISEVQI